MIKLHPYKKVILSGGYNQKAGDGGKGFYSEIIRGFSGRLKILECLFGLEGILYAQVMEKDTELLKRLFPEINFEFEIATPVDFTQQIQKADVIYFRGGEIEVLQAKLSKIAGWQDAIQNKVVVGTSAGAYVLSKYYIKKSGSLPVLEPGFGLLPIKTVAHYRSGFHFKENTKEHTDYWSKVDELMLNTRQDLATVCLREGEYKILDHETTK